MNTALTVVLECDDGDHVGTAIIYLNSDPLPEFLIWANRIFKLHEEFTYREYESSYFIPLEAVR